MTKNVSPVTLDSITNNGLVWIDIKRPTREKMNILQERFSFHELNLEDCLSKIQIPKIDKYNDHIFIILHFPTVDKEKSIPRSTQLAIFIGFNYLVTVQQGELKPLIEMFGLCKNNEGQRESFMGNSSGYLFHSIIDLLVDDLLHILMKLEGNLDDIEDIVFDEKVAIAREISLLRREITTLRRVVIPLRRLMLDLNKDIQKFSGEDLSLYFDDVKDHIDKVIEDSRRIKGNYRNIQGHRFHVRYGKGKQNIGDSYYSIYSIHTCDYYRSVLWYEYKFARRNSNWSCNFLWSIHFFYNPWYCCHRSCFEYDIIFQIFGLVWCVVKQIPINYG